MAREFGVIERDMWLNPRFRKLSPDGRYLWLYVCSAPRSTPAGCYVLPLLYAAADLQWEPERVLKGFQELAGKPFCVYDRAEEVVYIPGWHQHNVVSNANVAKHIARLLMALPDCRLKAMAIEKFAKTCKFKEGTREVEGFSWEPSQTSLDLPGGGGFETPPEGLASRPRPRPRPRPVFPTTSADLPLKGSETLSDPSVEIFGPRLDWLVLRSGRPSKSLRSMLGRWVSEQGMARTLEVLRACEEANAGDPVPWCQAAFKKRAEKPPGRVNGGAHHVVEEPWAERYRGWKRAQVWLPMWGDAPDEARCEIPPEIRAAVDAEFDTKGKH